MKSSRGWLIGFGIALLYSGGAPQAHACVCSTTFTPADSTTTLQCEVDACGPNTTFTFTPGIYRYLTLIPHDNDKFIGQTVGGQNAAILNGSELLTSFQTTTLTGVAGTVYEATGQFQNIAWSSSTALCGGGGSPACAIPEDLFFDSVPKTAVADKLLLTAGKWWFDFADGIIYFMDDPTGHTVETSVTPQAFDGPDCAGCGNVSLQNLVIAKYADPASIGAVESPAGNAGDNYFSSWTINNCEFYGNHGQGVYANSGDLIENSYAHDNGMLGFGAAQSTGVVFSGNIVTHNVNYPGYNLGYGPAGIKVGGNTGALRTVYRNNTIANNAGGGLWDDNYSNGTVYIGNTIINNGGAGIQNEISQNAVISSNTLYGNGYRQPTSDHAFYNGQIQIYNSRNADVSSNTIIVYGSNENAIGIENDDRSAQEPDPAHPILFAVNNNIHHNSISIYQVGTYQGGYTQDNDFTMFNNNMFDFNQYHVTAPSTGTYFEWGPGTPSGTQGTYTFNGFQLLGQELHGSIDTNFQPPPPTNDPTVTVTLTPRVYPNPWRSDKYSGLPMTFDQMASNSTVKIFTVSGHAVRTLAAPTGTVAWDLKNNNGEAAASGLYLYVITDDAGGRTRGKFAIIH